MTKKTLNEQVESIGGCIHEIRGMRIILDRDLAGLYGVETKGLNRAVRRNIAKFPLDFAFQLSDDEFEVLRYHNGTSNVRGGSRYNPWAFTEHGAIMAANVLRSKAAVEMSVFIVRAFVKMREALLSRHEMEKRLSQIENTPPRSRLNA